MKRVSFNVAKTLKEAGYPQISQRYQYTYEGTLTDLVRDGGICYGPVAPTYIDTWLWLWREKDIRIQNNTYDTIICLVESKPNRIIYLNGNAYGKDPEEAIIAAIEYLVTNNLIK